MESKNYILKYCLFYSIIIFLIGCSNTTNESQDESINNNQNNSIDVNIESIDNLFFLFNDESNKIIGRWRDSNKDYIKFIYKSNKGKCFLTTIHIKDPNNHEPLTNELVVKKVKGNKIYLIKELLGDINTNTGLPWADKEYTDYYEIIENGDLIIADKEGIIEIYDKVK